MLPEASELSGGFGPARPIPTPLHAANSLACSIIQRGTPSLFERKARWGRDEVNYAIECQGCVMARSDVRDVSKAGHHYLW